MKFSYTYSFIAIIFSVLLFTGCANESYQQAIPKESTALVSFDANQMSGINNKTLLRTILKMKNLDESGIDFTQKIYLFTSPDGNLGICAKVDNADKISTMLQRMGSESASFRDAFFSTIRDSWMVGYNKQSLLIMGPIPLTKQEEAKATIAKYLQQDEEESILASPIYQVLDSLDSPMTLVAQAQALPDKIIAPLMLGAPKDATTTDVLIAAKMKVEKGCWYVEGSPFSWNKRINQTIQESKKIYRPIQGKYIEAMPDTALFGMFVNVDGKQFLPILQNNKSLQVLLTGINQAIDLDNIIRSVNGDMSVVIPQYEQQNISISMAAQLAHSKWLADVDYWKQSVPAGGKLTDWNKHAFVYTNGKTRFFFGVTDSLQFYSGATPQEASNSIKASNHPFESSILHQIKGEKMVMIINVRDYRNERLSMITDLLRPVFGNIHTLVYKLN